MLEGIQGELEAEVGRGYDQAMRDTSVKFSKNKCFNVFKNRGHITLKIKDKRQGGGSERVCVYWAIERRREAK